MGPIPALMSGAGAFLSERGTERSRRIRNPIGEKKSRFSCRLKFYLYAGTPARGRGKGPMLGGEHPVDGVHTSDI